MLTGAWEPQRAVLRDGPGMAELDVRFWPGVRAVGLHGTAVELADGGVVAGDAVVVATGAVARTLPGQPSGAATLRSLDDAMALRAALGRAGSLLVVGAGFIGGEVAHAARSQGLDVTVLEALPVPCARVLGPEAGALAARLCSTYRCAASATTRTADRATPLSPTQGRARGRQGGPGRAELGSPIMFGRKKRGIDAKQLVPIMVEAFAVERMEVTSNRRAILIAMPGGHQAPLELETLLAGANQGEENLREFARGVVLGFMRGCRRQGVLVGTHYPLPDDDLAGQALLDAFGAAGLRATFVDPQRVGVQLANGSEAVTDVGRYRADVEGASPQAVAGKAAEFVRLSAEPLRDAGTGDAGTAGQHRSDLRLRLYPEEMLVEQLRSGVVTRELAPGLWETVAIDRPESVQPLPRSSPGDPDAAATDELFRVAVSNAVEDEFTLSWFDIGDVRLLHIDGPHPYMAAHVHVLGRYLDAPFPDGALVGFPLPEGVTVCPLSGIHPVMGLAVMQEAARRSVVDGHKAISKQVFWWAPSELERAQPGRDIEPGHRPALHPVYLETIDGRSSVRGADGFCRLVERFTQG